MKSVRAFIPARLPPKLEYTDFLTELVRARGKLGELNGALGGIKNPQLISAPMITKEAVYSSQIEGTQASLEDVYRIEALGNDLQKSEIEKDVREITNYREAIKTATVELSKIPIGTRLIKTLHAVLLDSVRGSNRDPGNFRKTQVFIGKEGASIEAATFVPPPANEIPALLTNWEKYVNGDEELDPLIIAGIAHYQFEAIHPFLDGNGRIGRILIPLILYDKKLLKYPSLFISQYFEKRRNEYYKFLNLISKNGDFSSWMRFFLDGIYETSIQATEIVNRVHELYDEMLPISLRLSAQYGKTLQDLLFDSPMISYVKIKRCIPEMTVQTVYNLLSRFESEGFLSEITGNKRNKVYRFEKLINIIS